jgi:mycothiol synthase
MPPRLPAAFQIRSATPNDVTAAAAVAHACDLEDIGEPEMFEDWLHDDWVRPRFDPSADAWVVTEQEGGIVAFAYTWDEEPSTLFDSTGYVHPAYRGLGIGMVLIDAVERRALRDRASVSPDRVIRVLQSFDEDASGRRDPQASGARDLFERLGYVPEKEYLHMEIEVPDRFTAGDAPAGILVRPRVETDDQGIVALMADAFDDPWDYEEAQEEFRRSTVYDPSLWHVALADGEMVGALFGYIANGRGQVSAVGVRDDWRRRGVAQAMLRAAFARFRERGASNVRLNVDRDNAFGATHLYERVGMHLRRTWVVVAKTLHA